MATEMVLTNDDSDLGTSFVIGGVTYRTKKLGLATAGVATAGSDAETTIATNAHYKFTDSGSGFPLAWVSDTLAGVTVSGSIVMHLYEFESVTQANAAASCDVGILKSDGSYVSLLTDTTVGTEMPLATADQTWSATPTSQTLAKGDRLVVIPQYTNASATTLGSGRTVTLNWRQSATVTACSRVTIFETLVAVVIKSGSDSGSGADSISARSFLDLDTGSGTENVSFGYSAVAVEVGSASEVQDVATSNVLHLAPVSTLVAGTWRTEASGTNLEVSVDEPAANDADYITATA